MLYWRYTSVNIGIHCASLYFISISRCRKVAISFPAFVFYLQFVNILKIHLYTFFNLMIPSCVSSSVTMSNKFPPSPGTMLYSISAFFPKSGSTALIRPITEPIGEDSGTFRWKMPKKRHIIFTDIGIRKVHNQIALF